MHQSDGVSLVWPPGDHLPDNGRIDRGRCSHEAGSASEFDRRLRSKLAQALLAPDDVCGRRSNYCDSHGFEQMADMFFMARTLTPDRYQLGAVQSRLTEIGS